MVTINKKESLSNRKINIFSTSITFKLPNGFIDFFNESNGGEISNDMDYIILWPLTEMIKLNHDYKVDEYAPAFFIFGSDGGDTAYCIEKKSGHIFEMPFIGMSNESAIFKCIGFNEFVQGGNISK